jgi:hydroxyacylglutathione hydrolase
MSPGKLQITAIPAFSDNYIWLLTGEGEACAVVDPGDHRPVLEVLRQRGLLLRHILLTHHHADHVGGVGGLLNAYPATVWGPADGRIRHVANVVDEGDVVALPELGAELAVLFVPGHTSSHIAYFGAGALFCGDTLFSMGCGRLFEGTPGQMQASLDKFAALPPETRVYCAHEYTQSNCAFALAVEPGNQALRDIAADVAEARAARRITLPSTIGFELAANPFMRTRHEDVVGAARARDPSAVAGASTMAVIRAWKDGFG